MTLRHPERWCCIPGVAGVPKPGAIDAAWPKPPRLWAGPDWAALCPNPVGAPKPPNGDAAGAAALALCPKMLGVDTAALAPWPKPPNAGGAAALAVVGWPKAGKRDAADEGASAPPNAALGAPVDAVESAMPKERAPVVPGAVVALMPKESPFPKGEAAGLEAADACCPRPPKAPKPVQHAVSFIFDLPGAASWCNVLLGDKQHCLVVRGAL